MKDRADYARKGIARGRSLVAFSVSRRHRARRRERVPHAVQDQRDLRPHRVRRRRQVQRVRDAARRRRAPGRPQGLLVRARRRERARARQRVRPDPRPGVHPRDEAVRGGDPRRAGGRRPVEDDELYHILYDGTVMDEEGSTVLGGQAEQIAEAMESRFYQPTWTPPPRSGSAPRCSPGPTTVLAADQLEVALLDRTRAAPRVPPHQGRRARSRSSTPARPPIARARYQCAARTPTNAPSSETAEQRGARPTARPRAAARGRVGARRPTSRSARPAWRRPRRRAARSGRRRAGPRARTRRPAPCRRR